MKKYNQLAKKIIVYVGGKENINSYYNCITRIRFNIKDKTKINIQLLKEELEIKGINFVGAEFQLIIGSGVDKLKATIDDNINSNKNNDNFIIKLKSSITGILVPIIPVFLVSGMLRALESTLIYFKLIQNIDLIGIENGDFFSGFIYIIANSGIIFVGLFVAISTAKHIKTNEIMSAFIAITLVAPILFNNYEKILIEIWIFKLGLFSWINSLMSFIFAIFLFKQINQFFAKIIPGFAEPFVRPLLAFISVISITLFVFGPLLNILDLTIFKFIELMGKQNYGLTSMLFGFLFMILVLSGVHTLFVIPFNIVMNCELASVLGPAQWISCYAQLGVILGVMIISKSKEIASKCKVCILPGLIFCVIEQSLYGVNIKKMKLFWIGCISGGIVSLVSGLLGIKQYVPVGAGGLFSIFGTIQGGWSQVVILLIMYLASIILSIILVSIFVRKNELEILKNK